MGVGPLSHQEIDAWARLFCIDISPFEVDVLRRLDRTFREHQANKTKPADADVDASRPMTPELFDSIWK